LETSRAEKGSARFRKGTDASPAGAGEAFFFFGNPWQILVAKKSLKNFNFFS